MAIVTQRKATDYTPDPRNANKGTERGVYMLDKSVEDTGLGRSIVVTADGTVVAGNKTLQAAIDADLVDVVEVETDGKALVVVRRKDWSSIDDDQARRYAYFDNRANEVSLDWDAQQIIEDQNNGVDLSTMFFDHELDEFAEIVSIEDGELDEVPDLRNMGDRKKLVKMALYVDGIEVVERAIAQTGERNRGEAIIEICRAYLNEERRFDF